MTLDCLLCGASGPQVRPILIEWAEPIGSTRFEVLPVCANRQECRARVEQQGDEWPLAETSRDAA
jgi:hypothetical protein